MVRNDVAGMGCILGRALALWLLCIMGFMQRALVLLWFSAKNAETSVPEADLDTAVLEVSRLFDSRIPSLT